VALVIGAPVFRYYPYVPGQYLPAWLRLLHISDDPAETARAPVGDGLLGNAFLSLAGLRALLADYKPKTARSVEKAAAGAEQRVEVASSLPAINSRKKSPARCGAFFVSTAADQSRRSQCRSAWILCDGTQRVPGDVPGYGGDRACLAADRDACGAVLSSWQADRDACGAVLSSWQVHRGLRQGERRRERESKCQRDCRQFHGFLLAFG
jgi:hypothetical protein